MSAPEPVLVAREFVEAFGRRDMAAVEGLFAADVTFQSPRVRLAGAAAVCAAMGEFAQLVDGVTILAAMQDGGRACVVYDMATGPFGTLRAVDLLTVVAGKITDDVLVFDTGPLG